MKIDFSYKDKSAGNYCNYTIHDTQNRACSNSSTNVDTQYSYRPAVKGGSVSFGKNLDLEEIVNSAKFNNLVRYVLDNESMFSALITLGVLTTIKPALTLSMPIADGKDKVAVASKEIVGGLVSYGLSTVLTKPIGIGVKKAFNNPAKYILNDADTVRKVSINDAHKKAMMTVLKNAPEVVVALAKAGLTIAIMPFVIKIINEIRGPHKPKKSNIQGDNKDLFVSDKLRNVYNSPNSLLTSTRGVQW